MSANFCRQQVEQGVTRVFRDDALNVSELSRKISRPHAEAGERVARPIGIALGVRQGRPNLADGQPRIRPGELAKALMRFLFATRQGIGWSAKAIDPDGRRMLCENPGPPARGFVIAPNLEVCATHADRRVEVQRVIGAQTARNLETLNRISR